MSGRPPQPTALKIARGNPGKRPLNRSEPKPIAATGEPPEFLDDCGRKKWFVMVPELQRLGLLTMVDEDSLAAYCDSVSMLNKAAAMIKAEGITIEDKNGKLCKHPAVAVGNEAKATIRQFAAEFGFTPSARVKLKSPDPVSEDPFDAFVKRKA